MQMGTYITNGGNAVIAALLAEQGPLTFTRAEIGSGIVTSEDAARERTSLISKVADAELISCTLSGGIATIALSYNNSEQNNDISIGEVGVFCKDPNDATQEVLYAYCTFGDTPDVIVASTTALYSRTYKVLTFVSSLTDVSVVVTPGGYVSQAELESALALKADVLLQTTASGTPGVDIMNPVFTGADGKMGTLTPANARIALGVPAISTVAVPLPASGWTAVEPYTQTVAVSGVTSSSNVIIAGDPSDAAAYAAWNDAGVYCSAQASGSLTFTAASVPETNVTANVMIVEVRS